MFTIDHHRVVSSTQTLAKNLIDTQKNSSQHIILADEQTEGRGRQNHKWHSPKGQFYASFIVKHTFTPTIYPFAMGLALYDILLPYCEGEPLYLKWPNDIYINQAKLCGILIEIYKNYVIIGVGVNTLYDIHVPNSPYNVQSIAINREFFGEMAFDIFTHFMMRCQETLPQLLKQWRQYHFPQHTHMVVNKGCYEGAFHDIADDGALILDIHGTLTTIYSGDVRV